MINSKTHICPVCNSCREISKICDVNGFDIFGCGICGAEHVHPMPTKNALKDYYDREQWFEGGETGGYENYDKQTAWSVETILPLLAEFGAASGMSILDLGCGYGTHLAAAAELGWKCFGVELSNHARKISQERLGNRAYIVESVDELIPHEFDVILMLDVIEHLAEPYALLYSLFSIGAITPKTRLIITTPNAGSKQAEENPTAWPYRHPPSHLVYYKADTFRFLLKKLHFENVEIVGLHPLREDSPEQLTISDFGGLLVKASGSDFTEFMRERYVPGTWSKIAEYEHLPRYQLAKRFAAGKRVLDFGCGTGYGSAALSEVACRVTGLDIDRSAIRWAEETHVYPNLNFHRCDDLGTTLPAGSFEVVTCFEMIEHVDYETQRATISSIARLLSNDGVLIISTPNPAVTALYGENPYHLREMTEAEFRELLLTEFPNIQIYEQRVQSSISFDFGTSRNALPVVVGESETNISPLAYIAFCSRGRLPEINSLVVFDETTDVIKDFIRQQERMFAVRYLAYRNSEEVANLQSVNAQLAHRLDAANQAINEQSKDLASTRRLVIRLIKKLLGRG